MRTFLQFGLFLALVATGYAQSNLILNPSFESPSVGSASEEPITPTDWSSSGGVDYVISNGYSDHWLPATNGTQISYLYALSSPESLSQSGIALSGGTTYDFSLDLSHYLPQPSGAITVSLSDGVNTASQTFSTTAGTWTNESWQFLVADTADYTLTITGETDTYPAIDNLSLTAVPEPATFSLLTGTASLLLAFTAALRRRVQ